VDLVIGADDAMEFFNLRAGGIAHRRRLAAIGALVALAGLVAIDLADVTLRWRALLLAPLWFASLCWFQASAKT
jgi:hypothetical protein